MRFRRLQIRFLLVVIVGAASFAAAAGWVAYRLGHQRALESGRSNLIGLVAALEKTAAIGAYTGDRLLLREVADGLARNDLVAMVSVQSADGNVMAQRGTAVELEAGAGDVVVERRLASPFEAAESVGLLRLRADSVRLEAVARREASTFAVLMVAQTLLVAVLLYCAAARLVSQPIVRLAGAMRMMHPGTSKRLAIPKAHADDEIGTLIGAANTMVATNEAALRRERSLRAEIEVMEAQYRQIFDSTSAGIFVLDSHGRLINGNPTVLKVIGSSARTIRELQGQDFLRQAFARPDRVRAMMDESARRGETISGDIELIARNGQTRWVHCLISVQEGRARHGGDSRSAEGPAQGLIEGVMYDVTERKCAEIVAHHHAEHDALTGLKNRAGCEVALDRMVADAAAEGAGLSVLFIDLDGFKRVNDLFGHEAGDRVLVHCAQRLQASMRRSSDLAARLGGDEFLIAMPNTGPGDPAVSALAASVLEALCAPLRLDAARQVLVGASIGIACFPHHGHDRRELMRAADEAMYAVKRHGKNACAMALTAVGVLPGAACGASPIATLARTAHATR